MSIVKPGDIITWKGAVARVVSSIEDRRVIGIEILEDAGKDKCSNCGTPQRTRFDVVESSPLFKENVEVYRKEVPNKGVM